ncbi:unnamed protein product [Polarella glacialis]|uniref:Fibronectin type-III domain-containing protein n=1 Tax=Polarella glacialis TaxID=89957 RepID=A0A813KQT2_POLGL|nr:unnamed protein product [Polarella glacialis]
MRLSGSDEWVSFPLCSSSERTPVNCTISNGLATNSLYDLRVRAFCVDPRAQGNYTEELEFVRTLPTPATAPWLQLVSFFISL